MMEEGRTVGFTLDGPRGPARVAQPGAIWLAKATGHPIIPFHAEAESHWTLRSWDAAQIPRPFSRVALTVGEPLWVPVDADAGVLDAKRVELEQRLTDLQAIAFSLLGTEARQGTPEHP
jgi:lysophospholipid acyltransferase (LPLAT)-like uncharacterized protein